MAKFDAVTELTDSFRLVFKNFGGFLQTQGVPILLLATASLAFTLTATGPAMNSMFAAIEAEDFSAIASAMVPIIMGGLVLSVLSFFASVFALVIGISFVDGLLRGETLTLGQAWEAGRPRLGNVFGTVLLVGLAFIGIVIGGAVLFFLIVPLIAALVFVIYLAVRWYVVVSVSIFEQHDVSGNLKRASQLTQGARGSIAIALILLWLAIVIPSVILVTPLSLASLPSMASGGEPAFNPAMQVIQWAIQTVFQLIGMFVATALMVGIYRKLETPAVAPPEPTWAVPDQ